MPARGAPQAASNSKGLILAVLVDGNKLSLRELVLCFMTCKTFRELLDGRGFCIGTAWLCAYLESGQSPAEILSRLRSARRSVAYERPLSRVDQVTSFLVRHEDDGVRWGWAWAQLLYQEPDGGVLCEGVKKMLWMIKGRLIKELHKCSGYYPGLCTLKGHSEDNPECICKHHAGDDEIEYEANPECPVTGHYNQVLSVAWSPCGNFVASGSWDNTIKVWDVEAGSEKCSLTGHSGAVYSVAWSPDGRLVASGSYDLTIRIWDVATGKEAMGPLTGHSNVVSSVAWSPCGNFVASGSDDGTIKIWDALTGSEKCSLKGHSAAVNSVAFSPDGKYVASGSGEWDKSDNSVRIWDVATGKEAMGPLKGHTMCPKGHMLQSFTTDADGWFCSSCGCKFRQGTTLWGCRTCDWDICNTPECLSNAMRLKCTLKGHTNVVTSVAWSPDGKLVASGFSDCTIRIWDAATGMETMAPLVGLSSSWVDVGAEIRALTQQVEQASDNFMACTGDYVVTADDCNEDTVLICEVLEGRESDDKSDYEQETKIVALFRCPSKVRAVACRPPYICAGCVRGQVLLLEAPFLCEGPGI